MTILFSETFDDGTLDAWDSHDVPPLLTFDDIIKHTGAYSLKTSGADIANAAVKFATNAIVYARCYWRFEEYPTSVTMGTGFLSLRDNANNLLGQALYGGDPGQTPPHAGWAMYYGGSVHPYITCDFEGVLGQWYCVEIMVDHTNNVVTMWVDGVQMLTHAYEGTADVSEIVIGVGWSGDWHPESHFDCVVVSTEYIGPEAGMLWRFG